MSKSFFGRVWPSFVGATIVFFVSSAPLMLLYDVKHPHRGEPVVMDGKHEHPPNDGGLGNAQQLKRGPYEAPAKATAEAQCVNTGGIVVASNQYEVACNTKYQEGYTVRWIAR